MVAGFHSGSYADDSQRARLIAGYGDFQLKFYGFGSNPRYEDDPIRYRMSAPLVAARYQWEVMENWFLGPDFIGVYADISSDDDRIAGSGMKEGSADTAGLGVHSLLDTRDNNLSPRGGYWLDISARYYSEAFGGNFNYPKVTAEFRSYHQTWANATIAWRVRSEVTNNDAPFYGKAHLRLHGFDTARYTDEYSAEGEFEIRQGIFERWTIVAGAGIGSVFGQAAEDDTRDAQVIYSLVGGLRWAPPSANGMNIRFDVAVSNDDTSWYLAVGDAF